MATPAEFERCLRRPALYREGPFALHLCWIDAGESPSQPMLPTQPPPQPPPTWRLGLVIPKRYEASAVARNTIKRRWRDAFRRGREAWVGEFGPVDVVVRLQSPLVPKPAKAGGKRKRVEIASVPSLPARVRARDRFDPAAMLQAFVERLRSRGGRPARVVEAKAS